MLSAVKPPQRRPRSDGGSLGREAQTDRRGRRELWDFQPAAAKLHDKEEALVNV